uniref:Cyclin-dependent kinase 20 n=1 Tax=Plectus sambesii TaxID=2011161 RepID=A0A914UIQ7_9BILA
MDKYEVLGRLGEGAHGIVLKGKQLDTKEYVALKKVLLRRLEDGIPLQVFREIKALQELNHENIICLREVFPHGSGLVLVFDFMTTDLGEMIRDYQRPLNTSQIKTYTMQLLFGVSYMHANNIMHRDLKPANLLIASCGKLKIADLGQACLFFKDDPDRTYDHQVATRWYRAPELLYGSRSYGPSVDMWAVGCILAEMLNSSALFPGENDIEQIICVLRLLGTPTDEDWPELAQLPDSSKISFSIQEARPWKEILPTADAHAIALVASLLICNPMKRATAQEAVCDPFFYVRPYPATNDQMPTPSKRLPAKPQNNLDFDPCSPIDDSLYRLSDLEI